MSMAVTATGAVKAASVERWTTYPVAAGSAVHARLAVALTEVAVAVTTSPLGAVGMVVTGLVVAQPEDVGPTRARTAYV